jgi:ATP-dependent RNA helicase RhlE
MSFQELGLAEPICRAVAADGYTTPTPIQTKAIPHVLKGGDLIGCAQTGTGKTGAFALPILHRLSESKADQRGLRVLVLAPTRELASQIDESFRAYGRFLRLRSTVIFGGVSQFHQVRALKQHPEILIATPGRLLDLMNQGHIDLRGIEVLVLDEADRMLDMGFIHDIRKIIKRVPQKRQTLFFSATMPDEIRALADSILHKPMMVRVDPVGSTVKTIAQSVYFVQRKSKPAMLRHVLGEHRPDRTLVFTRTKHGADKVVKDLSRAGIKAIALHGNKSQNARTAALNSFKSSKPPVLVATDIASRGIDVDGISLVVNFDVPNVPETYVHRIGRTARAGASGLAISFCDPEERGDLKAIERLTQQRISVSNDVPHLPQEPMMAHAAEPHANDHSHHNGHRRSAPVQHHSRSSERKPDHGAKKHTGFVQRGRGRRRVAGMAR